MVDVLEDKNLFLSHFERLEAEIADRRSDWLMPVRKAAIAGFAELGFPATNDEEWRFTNVAPIVRIPFEPAGDINVEITPQQLKESGAVPDDGFLLVFVNGRLAPNLCSVQELPKGVRIGSLAAAVENDPQLVEPHLARYADYKKHAFTALNTALMEDGAFVYIPRGLSLDSPINLLFVSTASGRAIVSHPRNLIVAETSSQATIVETYLGLGDGTCFTNAVTEVVAGENAVIDHYKLELESTTAFHIATLHLVQARSSNVTSHTVSFGGGLVRNDINVSLNGEGCDCTLNGLYVPNGSQHVDNHLVVEHAAPHCNSREFFKGVLDGRSKGVFSGRIIVRKDAQKTDAKQTNMSLLLSEEAQVESKPQLEIFADDVKCTHGATIGQVNEDAVFYLRTRGIAEKSARDILVYAFAQESVDNIRVERLRRQVERLLAARISDGLMIRGSL